MFYKYFSSGYKEIIKGVNIKTLVNGEKTLLSEFIMEKGSILPKHSHPYEQTGYLISGNILLTIGENTFEAEPGDSWCIPVNVEHKAEILKDSIAIEVFSPVREDYLTYKNEID